MICPRGLSYRSANGERQTQECLILEPVIRITTFLRSVVSSLYMKGKRDLEKLSNLSLIGYMMEEGFQLSQSNSNLTPKPACLATSHLDWQIRFYKEKILNHQK